MDLTCAECRFQMYGECRRYAPRAWPEVIYHREAPIGHDLKSRWPSVDIYSDGCGEFETSNPSQEPPPAAIVPLAEPCGTCGSRDGKEYFKPGMSGDCRVCGASDGIPF